jgi:hypothetical protein
MVVRFVCTTDDKQKYHKIKEKIFFTRSTIIREKIRELKDEYFAEFEVVSYGRTLYRELKDSDLCKHLRLDPNIKLDDLE